MPDNICILQKNFDQLTHYNSLKKTFCQQSQKTCFILFYAAQVAQQVMSLFKGALTVEKELEALELEKQMQEEETQRVTEQTSPSEKSSKIIPLTNEQVRRQINQLAEKQRLIFVRLRKNC